MIQREKLVDRQAASERPLNPHQLQNYKRFKRQDNRRGRTTYGTSPFKLVNGFLEDRESPTQRQRPVLAI
ncbi:unnamed protein product [Diplocarpon coronariae]|nr:hypothetical protein JHW43_008222 [Diplocarpon mali]